MKKEFIKNQKNKNQAKTNTIQSDNFKKDIDNIPSKEVEVKVLRGILDDLSSKLEEKEKIINAQKLEIEKKNSTISQLTKEKSELLIKLDRNRKSSINSEDKENLAEKIKKYEEEIKQKNYMIDSLIEKIQAKGTEKNFSTEGKSIAIHFISNDLKINQAYICEENEQFTLVEGRLYQDFPDYEENVKCFMVEGKKVSRFKTIKDNSLAPKDGKIVKVLICNFE